ncbi:MAG: hypothetical protein WBM86_02470 [Waterburya sp.]
MNISSSTVSLESVVKDVVINEDPVVAELGGSQELYGDYFWSLRWRKNSQAASLVKGLA